MIRSIFSKIALVGIFCFLVISLKAQTPANLIPWDFSSVAGVLNTVNYLVSGLIIYLSASVFKNATWFTVFSQTYAKVAIVAVVVGIVIFKWHFDLTILQTLVATIFSFWVSNGIHSTVTYVKTKLGYPTKAV